MWFLIGLLFEDHSTVVDTVESFISFSNWNEFSDTLIKQCCGSGFIVSGSSISKGTGSRVLMTKMWGKNTAEKLIYLFLIKKKIAIYLSLGLHKGRPRYRKSVQPSKENIKHFKKLNLITFFNFCELFLPSWIRIQSGSFYPNLLRPILWETSNYLIS